MLPDVDLLLGVFGIQHRTLTHSLVFWTIIFIPVFAGYRLRAAPYFVAVAQHILLGDLIVGKSSVLWPLMDLRLGLGLSILSPISLAMEGAGLAIFAAMIFRNGELFSQKSRILPFAAIIPIALFVILSSFGGALLPLVLEGSEAKHLEKNLPTILSSPNLQVAVVLHLALIALIVTSLLKTSLTSRLKAEQR